MKRSFLSQLFLVIILFFAATSSQAQYLLNNDSAFKAGTANSGRIWGYVFGDFYYKGHADSLNRGGNNQYSGIPQSRNAFQFRRLYLGYDYNISDKFTAELLLAAEDNFPAFNPPNTAAASGDQAFNNKIAYFIKYADVQWKNIWKGTNLVVGQQPTPAFPFLTEKIWAYRSIDRTIADIRRTPSFDLGVGLRGVFDPAKGNFGYNLLVANGSSAKPATNGFKWFYGDVYAYAFDKKLVFDFYADYYRLNWQPGWHHDRQMLKGYIAYNTPALTIGVEGYINTIKNDTKANRIAGGADTINTAANGISFYVHGDIVKNRLRFFARLDTYNPNGKVDNNKYLSYSGVSSPNGYNSVAYKLNYNPSTGTPASIASTVGDPTSKEIFVTAGLDYSPAKNIHFMPNIWYNRYATQLTGVAKAAEPDNYDLVYRMTFYYTFGK